MKLRLAAAAVSVVALVGLAACTDAEPTPTVTVTVTADPGAEPGLPEPGTGDTGTSAPEPGAVQTNEDGTISFEGDVQTHTIKVGPQEMEAPLGITLPEDSLVSDAQPAMIMVIDEDPAAVIESVTSSAEEAGYEVYAQPNESTWVFVGHGNAVLLSAYPQGQILTWGPEAMKDVLAQG